MSFVRSPAVIRRILQMLFTLICLSIGYRFALFLAWVSGASPDFAARPAGVEAFLPIAALAGLKNLLFTGAYDPVHPAGLTILLVALGVSLIFRRSFCAAICPVGLASDLLGKLGGRLRIGRRSPRLLGRAVGVVQYLLLAFFIVSIFVLMSPAATQQFLVSPYNLTADASLFRLFAHPSRTFLTVLGLLAALSLFYRNAWCRWLCPYGALLGLFGLAGPCSVKRDEASCDGCRKCQRVCPMDIAPGAAARSPLCMGCGQCVEACPRPGTLSLRLFGRRVPAATALLGGAALFLAACLLAMALGAWDNGLPGTMLKGLYSSVMR